MTRHADQPPAAHQPPFAFPREGPPLPRTILQTCQDLLAQLLVEVMRSERPAGRGRAHE